MNRPSYLLFKKCNKCGEILHISKFYKNKEGRYGVRPDCKECHNKRSKKFYKENKNDKGFQEKRKQYREEHKEEINIKKREYYENNKEDISEYKKKYRKYHPRRNGCD